jgi:hypothetical protein
VRKKTMRRIAECLGVMLAALPIAAFGPVQQNGWIIYADSHTEQTVPCAPTPILLRGSHTDMTLRGACAFVRIEGEHNDITVQVAPAAVVEVTGAHNDVTWVQIAPGAPPQLLDRGPSNSFHRG